MPKASEPQTDASPQRRPALFVLAAAAAALLLLTIVWLLLARGGQRPPQESELTLRPAPVVEPQRDRVQSHTAAHSQAAAPSPTAAPPPSPATPEEQAALDARSTAIAMTKQLIDDYKKRAAYPPETKPITQEQDPLLSDREVSPISAGGPDGEDPVLTVFPEQISFEEGETPRIFAHLTVGGEKVAAREITGTVFTHEMVPVGELVFHDDGQAGDAEAFDNVYTVTWTPPTDDTALAASYFVRVIAFSLEGIERRAGTSFQVSRPHARLTGRFRDRLDQGSLVIEAEVEVVKAGRFHLAATLYSNANRPLGLAQSSHELEPGMYWLPLRFYGRLFHGFETGTGPVDGPYVLRFVSLMTTTSMPNALSRLVEPKFVTQPYRASQFTAESFNDPFYLEAIERETEELRRLEAMAENPE
ncbi:MAG: hypothetical protein N3C12_12670 [Candidatus Binatia bacterium]|nr:hypothetical protein [Candidatus Binatia bacterium]